MPGGVSDAFLVGWPARPALRPEVRAEGHLMKWCSIPFICRQDWQSKPIV